MKSAEDNRASVWTGGCKASDDLVKESLTFLHKILDGFGLSIRGVEVSFVSEISRDIGAHPFGVSSSSFSFFRFPWGKSSVAISFWSTVSDSPSSDSLSSMLAELFKVSFSSSFSGTSKLWTASWCRGSSVAVDCPSFCLAVTSAVWSSSIGSCELLLLVSLVVSCPDSSLSLPLSSVVGLGFSCFIGLYFWCLFHLQ